MFKLALTAFCLMIILL